MLKFPVLAAALVMACACNTQPKTADVKDTVEKSLKDAGLRDVSVSQDREKGVVTLNGHVPTDQDKEHAESLAKTDAPGQVVANQIGVEPPAAASVAKEVSSDQDDAIEKNLDASFTAAGFKGIKHKTKNGVVTLTGSVPAPAIRNQAEIAAKQVPNVVQVVNEIQNTNARATSSN